MNGPHAVVLLSGGLDSTTALYETLRCGKTVSALTVDYGQLHHKEIEYAKRTAASLKLRHEIVRFSLPWKGSALLDASVMIPQNRPESAMGLGIPATYVPARNTIFLALAASYAEAAGAAEIVIGANALDYSGYPDCRPAYLKSMAQALTLGTKFGDEGGTMVISAPLVELSKKEIVELGARLGVPFEHTWSCYKGKEQPCGRCDSCLLRAKGFKEAGLTDPLLQTCRGEL